MHRCVARIAKKREKLTSVGRANILAEALSDFIEAATSDAEYAACRRSRMPSANSIFAVAITLICNISIEISS